MEFHQLRYSVAAAEELGVSRAAERVHVSQPALSRQIRLLEEELALKLSCRTCRPGIPAATPAFQGQPLRSAATRAASPWEPGKPFSSAPSPPQSSRWPWSIPKETIRKGDIPGIFAAKADEARSDLANRRLQAIASLPDLAIFSDEAHHTYGAGMEKSLKRVRETINYLHLETDLIAVVNTTGTPYLKRQPLLDVIF